MKNSFILIPLIFVSSFVFGQGQFNNWYCGYGAGMNFNSGAPTIITPNPMNTDDNSATVSDASGNLLFFANGTSAYDRNGNIMPNGSGLIGNISAGQTATIVQMPGNDSLYYLFIMDAQAGPNGSTYNIVNMNLNGGLGDIVSGQKNITILAPATEKIAPIRHANGVDVWILIHEWNSDAFRAYLLTASGLSTTPVITHIGTVATGGYSPGYNAMGQLICNNANNKVAAAVYSDGNIQLFDFDNSTGILSNTVLITQYRAFGLQFSSNGNLLYTTGWSQSTLYQYSLSTYTAAAISASQVNLGTCNGEGYLQMGPDGKIYVAKWQTNYIGVINNPNNSGSACNFVDQGFYTGTYQSSAGLIDKIMVNTGICHLPVHLGNDTTICNGATIILRDTFSNARSLWSTGDTTPTITVSTGGSYWLKVTQGTCMGTDTINISFVSPPTSFSLGNDTTYCGPFSRTLSAGNPNTIWSTRVTSSSISISTPGGYWAMDSNTCGEIRDTIVISQNPLPVVNLGNDTDLCSGTTLTLNATTSNANYSWQNGSTNPAFTVTSSGTYWVSVTVNGCSTCDSIVIGYINPLTFNIGNDTAYCGSFSRTLTAGIAHTMWSNGDTALSITVTAPGTYWGGIIACGDTLSDSITIIEKPLPVVNLGNDTMLCIGNTLSLNATTANAGYLWQNGSTASTFTVSNSGIYWVDVTVNGCTKPDSIDISYASPPVIVTLGRDTTICQDSSVILNVFEPLAHYLWSNGDITPSIIAIQSGTYMVTVSNVCGSTTASESITVKQCVCKVAIPTAFSPNNDGKNDAFGILTDCPVQDFQLDIFNRWGQKIFSTNSVSTKWDGTYREVPQPIGVYVYMVRYRDPYIGEEHNQAGNVTLVR